MYRGDGQPYTHAHTHTLLNLCHGRHRLSRSVLTGNSFRCCGCTNTAGGWNVATEEDATLTVLRHLPLHHHATSASSRKRRASRHEPYGVYTRRKKKFCRFTAREALALNVRPSHRRAEQQNHGFRWKDRIFIYAFVTQKAMKWMMKLWQCQRLHMRWDSNKWGLIIKWFGVCKRPPDAISPSFSLTFKSLLLLLLLLLLILLGWFVYYRVQLHTSNIWWSWRKCSEVYCVKTL